jgi:hypothetical protein
VLVTGGRYYRNGTMVDRVLSDLHRARGISLLIQGDANGADNLAKAWAIRNGVPVLSCPAAWGDLDAPGAVIRYRQDGAAYNVNAGFQRNGEMLREQPEICIAFKGGRGTRNMIDQAKAAGVEVYEVLEHLWAHES